MGDEYGGGIVAIADPVSGELVIVPNAERFNSLKNYQMSWINAVSYAAAYDDGTNTDYRLITKAEALAILTNNALLSQLGLTGTENFWTIEEIDLENAYVFAGIPNNVYSEDKDVSHGVFPVRKVNFYGLPLIESEFGGGLVYDVVAETRTVHIIPEWVDVNNPSVTDWDTMIDNVGSEEIQTLTDWTPVTRAQATKIFENISLITLAGLPTDANYWTGEEVNGVPANAYAVDPSTGVSETYEKTNLYYGLPVRSEVVPET